MMFSRTPVRRYEVSQDFRASPWMDGDRQQIRIRERYLPDVAQYYARMPRDVRSDTSEQVRRVIQALMTIYMARRPKTEFYKRFVDIDATKEVCVVFTNPKSTHIVNFIHHLCLTMGTYVTELDFLGLTPLEALRKAGLLLHPEIDPPPLQRLENSKHLMNRYIEEELV